MIRSVNLNYADEICEIYNYYVQNTIITFEEKIVTPDEMTERIRDITKELPWLVFSENKTIVGYAFGSKWKSRCGYRRAVESTIYLLPDAEGRGIGTRLYTKLLNILRKKNYHAVIGGIALPNDKSIALHEKLGFGKVAHFKEVGLKFGKWIDVGYWELVFAKSDK